MKIQDFENFELSPMDEPSPIITFLRTENPQKVTLANSEDPDEILTCDPSIYTWTILTLLYIALWGIKGQQSSSSC